MPHTLLYIIGEPGIGKSTLMATLTAGLHRTPLRRPGRDLLTRNGLPTAVELGGTRARFPGTDALPMDAINTVEPYIVTGDAHAEADLLLGEGARLANHRFLTAAVRVGYRTHLIHLTGPDNLAATRRHHRGTHQNHTWLAGARTRADRLANHAPTAVHVHQLDANQPPEAMADQLRTLVPALPAPARSR